MHEQSANLTFDPVEASTPKVSIASQLSSLLNVNLENDLSFDHRSSPTVEIKPQDVDQADRVVELSREGVKQIKDSVPPLTTDFNSSATSEVLKIEDQKSTASLENRTTISVKSGNKSQKDNIDGKNRGVALLIKYAPEFKGNWKMFYELVRQDYVRNNLKIM